MSNNQPSPTRLHLGAAYYPEHWPEERWVKEIMLMKEAGLTVVRMAEFAWSTLEPQAGQFQFEWLDRAIDMLSVVGIKTVMGTPTAAPPAWLVQQCPDLLAVTERGQRVQFGNRCHYCVTSPDMHTATRRIVTAMAEHFGSNPHIIGWQFDNEYNRICYCERCRGQFQDFLKERFVTLDELNLHWSTAYWSQTYSDWSQIPIPIGAHNPGLMLEFKRFTTHNYRQFQKLQLDLLRLHLKEGVWVTHNFMGWYDGYDHYEMAADLDIASWDWYIGSGHHDYRTTGAIHDLTRGFKQKNFWVMETQPGSVNWSPVNNMLNKGEGRAMAWHAVGHGADAIVYWQWRSALGGQEQYHGSLVDPSGQPRPFYSEVQQIGQDFARVNDLLAGSEPVKPKVAILNDYESRWSIQWQAHNREFSYVDHLLNYYRAFANRNIPVDIISSHESLENYRIVILPALLIQDDDMLERLTTCLKRGGNLVFTLRTGMKDRYNALLPSRQPGALAKLTGVEVEEYYALREPVPVIGNFFKGESRQWAERLKVFESKATSIMARYGKSNGWLDDQPAITVGASHYSALIYYVGAYLDEDSQQQVVDRILQMRVIKPVIEAPKGVEVCQRVNPAGQQIFIIINHERQPQTVTVPWTALDHLTSNLVEKEFKLDPYEVAVITKWEPPAEPTPQ
jgi:beta-galactosidase